MSTFVSTNRFCIGVENSGLDVKDIENVFVSEKGYKMIENLETNRNKKIYISSSPIYNDEIAIKIYG